MATRTAFSVIHGAPANRLRRLATYASVAVAALLIAAKFVAWLETGSVALLSSLVDSLLDAVASLVNLFAVRHAMSPAVTAIETIITAIPAGGFSTGTGQISRRIASANSSIALPIIKADWPSTASGSALP